jgi:hypothetical protein
MPVNSTLHGHRCGNTRSCTDNIFVTDFVVGAPYEESGTGVIYIYHGGKRGPKREVSQRIVGSEVHPQILGFGISFSRSLDVDGNHYPGKSKIERKVVLRSRQSSGG